MNKNARVYMLLQSLGFLGLLLLVGAQPVSACTCWCDSICSSLGDCCPWCSSSVEQSAQVEVTSLAAQKVQITVSGLQTMEMGGGSCAAAVQEIPGVKSINSMRLINSLTGETIYAFSPNEVSGRSFESLMAQTEQAGWWGFKADVLNFIPERIPTHFIIEATLERGVNPLKLAARLRAQGLFGGGSSNPDGALDLHHVFVRKMKNLDVQVAIPGERPHKPAPRSNQ